ncbi:hypothetical protein [Catenulispora sp. MAP5-51]|uniref:hypothetical protein n=1 Tax=Catenulispora sp. MAP5-51 TaxID=3156298 RepID=UPI00351816D7
MSMWCLNQDCAYLDEAEPARDGDGPWTCPACGEGTFVNALTADMAGEMALEAMVITKVSIAVWSAWARTAIRAAKQAATARQDYDRAPDGRKAPFAGLEFEAGMTAVAAAAFAVDGFYACEAVPKAARTAVRAVLDPRYAPDDPPRHEVVREGLKACFAVNGATATQWSKDIKWLYSRRNPIVHSFDQWETPTPRSDGLLTTVKRENYSATEAARAVNVMLAVLTYCAAHPGAAYAETTAWATSNRKAAIDGLDGWWRTQGWHPFDGQDVAAADPILRPGWREWLRACPLWPGGR